MHQSTARILTTHVGSLPRPPALAELLLRHAQGEPVAADELARHSNAAVREVVRKQHEVGIDIGNNGEQPRVAFHTDVAHGKA